MTQAAFNVAARLNAAQRAFSEINAELRDAIEAMRKGGDLPEACRGYKALSDAYEAMNDERKAIYEQIEGVSRGTIPELLTEAGVSNITIDYPELGVKFRFGKNQRVSVSMLDKEAGQAWLKDNGGEGLLQVTVNASSLSKFAKEVLQERGMDLPADIFKTSTMVHTSVTKA